MPNWDEERCQSCEKWEAEQEGSKLASEPCKTCKKFLTNMKGSEMGNKPYGLGRFLLDLILIAITGGLWFFWMVFKFLRKNS